MSSETSLPSKKFGDRSGVRARNVPPTNWPNRLDDLRRRPLPGAFRPGRIPDAGDVKELRVLLARREQDNQRLYHEVTDLTRRLEQAQAVIEESRHVRLRDFAFRLLARWL
jgi:hypothetical protein